MKQGFRLATVATAMSVMLVSPSLAQDRTRRAAREPTKTTLRQKLESRLRVKWSQVPLRQALDGLATSQDITIFLDRNVDPDQKLDLEINNDALGVTLSTVANAAGAHVCYLGPVVYIGPKETTSVLPTVAAIQRESISKLAKSAQRPFRQTSSWQWTILSTPRELIQELADQSGAAVRGLSMIPHDLWPETVLPTMHFTDRLSLVLAGFGLSFDLANDGKSIQFVPLPTSATITRSYRPRGSLSQTLDRIVATFPTSNARQVGRRVQVDATWQQHEQIEQLLSGERPSANRTGTRPVEGEKRFRMNVQNVPAGAVLKTVVSQASLTIEVSANARGKLAELVSVQVEQATLEELLHETLDPVDMSFQLEENHLKVWTADDN